LNAPIGHPDAKSDAVQKELSELFPSKDSPTLQEEILPLT